ncbi:MAG: hypothetical protein EB127_15305 [Alphaproteobacteria bacterium]|nr:hypothetical protein [Alphaproteobacteria bacterium]
MQNCFSQSLGIEIYASWHEVRVVLDDGIKIGIGDVVLDCFAGSGTTGVACKKTDRQYILIEQDKNYYDITIERMNC